ncbi:MAG: ABC transporter permease [Gemmatimonadaceae bacterium]
MEILSGIFESTLRGATPLALAALGEMLIERSGIINVGLEGSILAGAFGAAFVALALGADMGLVGGAVAGALMGSLFCLSVVWLRADQIITGTAITLLALGVTGAAARYVFGEQGVALTVPTLSSSVIPGLSQLPVVGRALFAQPYVTYLTVACTLAVHWWITRTHAGLALRAIGESPSAAMAAGIRVRLVRTAVVLTGSALAGMSGAVLVLAQAGTFVEGMSAGRGFIAIAIVALGHWRPLPVLAAACLFGAASALQFTSQALGWTVPYQLFLALPYLLTLAVLLSTARRAVAPVAPVVLGNRDQHPA